MQMKAIWFDKPDCHLCIDYGFGEIDPKFCKKCIEMSKYEVEVLQTGVGMFGTKAVILMKDGGLKTVHISSLSTKK